MRPDSPLDATATNRPVPSPRPGAQITSRHWICDGAATEVQLMPSDETMSRLMSPLRATATSFPRSSDQQTLVHS